MDQAPTSELKALLEGLGTEAEQYFERAEAALAEIEGEGEWAATEVLFARDRYWSKLPAEVQDQATHIVDRLVSLMGRIASELRNSLLASEGDQRDVMMGTKVMRAALLLRHFRAWDPEILHDEDVVLGVTPAGQSDDRPSPPDEAARAFGRAREHIAAIIDLVAASQNLAPFDGGGGPDSARYRPGTAFIMMSMDKSQPDLDDVSDAIKDTFKLFDIRAVRADDIEHEELITSRIITEIRTAEFCLADLSGGRPNVYYEVGYAHALGRRVILFRKTGTGLHFDLAGYNCPEYTNIRDLKEKLTHRLQVVTNKTPKAT